MGQKTIVKLGRRFENGLAYLTVFLLALIPTLEVVARQLLRSGVKSSSGYIHHLVLLIAFVGGMITSREGKHLALSLNLSLHPPLKDVVGVVNGFLSATITTALMWSSLSFAFNAFDTRSKIGVIPILFITLIMVVGYGVMAARFVFQASDQRWLRRLTALGFLLGTLLAFESIVNVASLLMDATPGFVGDLLGVYYVFTAAVAVPLIFCLLVAAILGTPIFVVLGGIAYLLFARLALPLEVVPNEAYSMLISHSIPAIPLFTVTGFILSESKASERLVRLFRSFFSWIPGGLAIMAILVCSFFTTFTGASGVTILALGGLLFFVLVEGKYKSNFSTGLLTASGSIGLLFPPSLPIIIYGVTAGISIKDMFVGGILPGFVMVSALVVFGIVFALKHDVVREPLKIREALAAVRESIWEILLPVVILVSFFGGLTTLVESAAIAVLYSLLIEVFIHRDLGLRDLGRVLLKSVPIIGGVLTILALAKGLSYYIVDAQIPLQLTAWVQANIGSKYLFLLLLNIALLITGCFMDIFSAILVVVPLILPLGNLFGIHPVHLGIIFLANMELGYLTPPVGLNLFLASYRFNEPMSRVYRDVLPFFLIQLAAVLLITYLPFLSTGLLHWFGS